MKTCWICETTLPENCGEDTCERCLNGNTNRDTADEQSAEENDRHYECADVEDIGALEMMYQAKVRRNKLDDIVRRKNLSLEVIDEITASLERIREERMKEYEKAAEDEFPAD